MWCFGIVCYSYCQWRNQNKTYKFPSGSLDPSQGLALHLVIPEKPSRPGYKGYFLRSYYIAQHTLVINTVRSIKNIAHGREHLNFN